MSWYPPSYAQPLYPLPRRLISCNTNDGWRLRILPNIPIEMDLNTQLQVLWGTFVIGNGKADSMPKIERPPYIHTAPRGIPLLGVTIGPGGATDVDKSVGGGKNWILSHWAMWSTEGAPVAAAVIVSDGNDFLPVWTGTLAAAAASKETAQVGAFNPPIKMLYPGFVRFNAAMTAAHVLTTRLWYYEVDEE